MSKDAPWKWDIRFLDMAKLVASWSKDPSTKCGAVIVDSKRRVVSVGYNGFPRDMPDTPELYDNREEKYSRIIHCEVNALNAAGKDVTGCTLYTYPCITCDRCFVQMVQAGITNFFAPKATEDMISRWGPAMDRVRRYVEEINSQGKGQLINLIEIDY